MKKFFTILSILLVLAMGLSPIAFASAKTAQATQSAQTTSFESPRTDRFLLSPSLVAQSSNATFVYDEEISSIKAIQNGSIVLSVHMAQTPIAMQFAANHLFILMPDALSAYSYFPKTDSQQASLTEVPIDFAFPTMSYFSILQESTNHSLFIQLSNGSNIELKKYTLTYNSEANKFELATSETFNSATLPDQSTNAEGKITTFAVQKSADGYKIVCSDKVATYALTCTSAALQSCEKLKNAPSKSICTHGQNFVCMQSESIIFFDDSFSQLASSTINFKATNICSNGTNLIASVSTTATIHKLLPNSEIIFKNEEIVPDININSLEFGSVLNPNLQLYEKPYSVSGRLVEANQNVIILSENGNGYEGFSYVTFAQNNQNYYGYLPTEQIRKKQAIPSSYQAKTATEISVFTLPSNVADETNKVICTLSKNEQVTVISNAANITNNGQIKFVQIQTQSGSLGFVELANISPTADSSSLRQTKANATTKCATTLYEGKSEENPLFSLPEGARIKLFGLLNPNSTYTRVQIEDNNGVIRTGYIKTADIKPDNITTLQLTGIILIAANALLLGAIITFVVVQKKRKSAETK